MWERSLQLTLYKLCFLFWPNSPSPTSTLLRNAQHTLKWAGEGNYFLGSSPPTLWMLLGAVIWQLNFSTCFLHLPEQSTVVSSGKKPLRQICKTKYESIIVRSQLIKQWGMAGSDLLGKTVVNFSCSIQTTKGKKRRAVNSKGSINHYYHWKHHEAYLKT